MMDENDFFTRIFCILSSVIALSIFIIAGILFKKRFLFSLPPDSDDIKKPDCYDTMSLRGLVDGDCGGVNPLMQLGGHFSRDSAYKEEGFNNGAAARSIYNPNGGLHQEQMVTEFLGQISGPPKTFNMDNLLEEMREIEHQNFHPSMVNAPKVIQEVTIGGGIAGAGGDWAVDFALNSQKNLHRTSSMNPSTLSQLSQGERRALPTMGQHHSHEMPPAWSTNSFVDVHPVESNVVYAQEFFDVNQETEGYNPKYDLRNVKSFFESMEETTQEKLNIENVNDEWLQDFQKNKEEEAGKSESYYDKFWSKLQKDWTDLAENENHPWLSQQTDFDPYKEYDFVKNNPMADNENAFEKGKEFLTRGDIPSAVLCFEAAVKQQANAENHYAWELLGLSQAENEMDPNAIAALKTSLDFKPDNLRVLMALAVSYTNESLQSQALSMLAKWLKYHPKYNHLVPPHLVPSNSGGGGGGGVISSLIGSSALKEMQGLFIDVVQKYPETIDPDVQEALGVLFNLSSEYDKAVDCFQAALNANPNSSKTWNRLGASLANGNRSIEAVEAYKRALELQPGFIRARYNVGIICMNLKSYKEAAEHLLTALNMQATSPSRSGLSEQLTAGINQMSDVIWSTLRMVFALMGRDDLKTSCANKDLNSLNNAIQLE